MKPSVAAPIQNRSQLMPLNENREKWVDEQEHLQGSIPNISHLNSSSRSMATASSNVFRSESDPAIVLTTLPPHQQMLKNPHNMDSSSSQSPYMSKPNVGGAATHHQNQANYTHIYTVKFKRSQRTFILSPRMQHDAKIGCYVKVEADRGEDLGIVTNIVRSSSSKAKEVKVEPELSAGNASAPTAATADLKKIIRLATNDEITLLTVKRKEEDDLLQMCRAKTLQRALPMNVVDAEYQFDRNKLTFFFEAEGRVDFRELVRDLFSLYKTRIWMQQIDKAGAPPLLADTQVQQVPDTATGNNEYELSTSSSTNN